MSILLVVARPLDDGKHHATGVAPIEQLINFLLGDDTKLFFDALEAQMAFFTPDFRVMVGRFKAALMSLLSSEQQQQQQPGTGRPRKRRRRESASKALSTRSSETAAMQVVHSETPAGEKVVEFQCSDALAMH